MTLRQMLTELGWSKAELARRLGVFPSTVTAWDDDPPQYAVAYLSLALEMKDVMDRAVSTLKKAPRQG